MPCLTCPSCGYDLERVENFQLGSLSVIRGCEIRWKGELLDLTMSERLIVIALAKADGAIIGSGALTEAVGYEGDQTSGILNVYICRIRKKFRAVDPGFNCVVRDRGRSADGGARWLEA